MPTPLDDLTGRRFGRLVVLDRGEDYVAPRSGRRPRWRVRCDCGEVKDVRATHLRSGQSRSCGCLVADTATRLHLLDLTGLVVGKLEVLGRGDTMVSADGRHQRLKWRVRCACGAEKQVLGQVLRLGKIRSCGAKGCRTRRTIVREEDAS